MDDHNGTLGNKLTLLDVLLYPPIKQISPSTTLTFRISPWGWFRRWSAANSVPREVPPGDIWRRVANFVLTNSDRRRKSWQPTALRMKRPPGSTLPNRPLRRGWWQSALRPVFSYFFRSLNSMSPKQKPGWVELTISTSSSGTLSDIHSSSSKPIPPKRSSCSSFTSASNFRYHSPKVVNLITIFPSTAVSLSRPTKATLSPRYWSREIFFARFFVLYIGDKG